MKTIGEEIRELAPFEGLGERQLELITGCAQNTAFTEDEYIFREGEEANTFYAIRRGLVALEVAMPGREPLVIETIGEGEVLGWSWLFPPYRTRFDARVVETVHAISFDGACLRGKCDSDHELGYTLMNRFAQIAIERLQATRVRLMDIYGPEGPGG